MVCCVLPLKGVCTANITMNAPRLKQVEEIFESALAVDPSVRDVFVRSHCGEDIELLSEVRSLLECHNGSTTFLETPAIDLNTVFPAAVAAQTELEDPLLGAHIASYRIDRRLGTGGMGVVYLAEQRQPRRTVALKLIRPGFASPSVLQRFELESLALGRLKHPGIASIYEAGTAQTALGTQPYFAMEYIAGRPLLQFAADASLSINERIEILAKVADAVQHAHNKGVIHRDLKPGNVLVEAPAGPEPIRSLLAARRDAQPKILDFGVARISDSGARDESMHTAVGGVIGTIPYMSPEQFGPAGSDSTDTRTDVYALGVIAFELFTGRLPFEVRGVSIAAAAKTICECEPPAPASINRELCGDLDTILLKAIEKDPTRRYQTASALSDDLRRVLVNQPILARPASAGYQFRKLVARHKVPAALIAAILLLLVGFGAWMSILQARTDRLRVVAEQEAIRANEAKVEQETQRVLAERRELSARRVKNVLIDSFRATDPTFYRSRDTDTRRLFAEEILGVGADRVASTLSTEPLLQSELQSAISLIYDNLGLYPEAMDLMQRAISTRREILGDQSPEVAELLHSYAQSAHSSGDFDLACSAMSEAASILEASNLRSRPLYNSVQSQLGTYLLSAGRIDEAMLAFENGGLLSTPIKGHEHRVYAVTLNGVAGVLNARKQHPEAEAVLRKAIELASVDANQDEAIFGSLRNNLAWVLYQQRQYDAALDQAHQSLTIRQARLGKDHAKTADTLQVLGIITAEAGMPSHAEPMLTDALRIRETKTPSAKGLIGESQCALATCLSYLGRFDEGEPLMRAGVANMLSDYGVDHVETRHALDEAVRFFQAWDKPDAAREFASRLRPVPPDEP